MDPRRPNDKQCELLQEGIQEGIPAAAGGEAVRAGVEGFGDAPAVPVYKRDGKFLRGKDDRLFLDNDENDVLLQHTGQRLFTSRELRHWRLLLESRVAMLEKMGIPYFHLVPPNAHSVYPEDLPDHVHSHHIRPIHQFVDELREKASFAKLIYPLDELLAAKPRPLYPKTDAHWTGFGAFVAYEQLADQMSQVVDMHRVSEGEITWVERMRVGELGFKVEPPQASIDVGARIDEPAAYLVSDNCVINTGMVIVTECPCAPATTCVVLGDSFTERLLPLLASSFGRCVYAYSPRMDYDFIREHKADAVICVLNERFMVHRPNDFADATVMEMAQDKIAHGLTREPTPIFRTRGAA